MGLRKEEGWSGGGEGVEVGGGCFRRSVARHTLFQEKTGHDTRKRKRACACECTLLLY